MLVLPVHIGKAPCENANHVILLNMLRLLFHSGFEPSKVEVHHGRGCPFCQLESEEQAKFLWLSLQD